MATTKRATKKAAKKTAKAAGSQLTGTDDDKLTSLTDNSVSASEMSAMRGTDDKKPSLAATDETVESLNAEDAKRKEEEDNSEYGRLSRSGYVLNEDQVDGRRWIGIPWQQDEEEKRKGHIIRVTPLADARPFTGLQVRPKNGEPFAVPEVGKDVTSAYWLSLMIPSTKKSFIEA
jgi:hypothetical protein